MRTPPSFVPLCSRAFVFVFLLAWLSVSLVSGSSSEARAAELWKAEAPIVEESRFPAGTLVFSLDHAALQVLLDLAPTPGSSGPAPALALPLPDGTWESFSFRQSRVMHPELAAKYPDIRTFVGIGRNSRWRARFEFTEHGFGASIWSPKGRAVIEPAGGSERYASVRLKDLLGREAQPFSCEVQAEPGVQEELENLIAESNLRGGVANGDLLRTYEVAIAATGEYTGQHGGTVSGALAAIATAVNRLNEIMGLDWSVALELIPNNNLIVYTNPATDPYSNGNTFAMLGQNQANLDAVIGNANYDYGHVLGTGGGGVANLLSVCIPNNKARGVSTSFSTSGEVFHLLVAHEMGHQFGGSHTFNGTAGNCGPNRTASSAYEPGSGSTIMAYAGICGSHDLQNVADPYYHTRTYTQVITNISAGGASNCPTVTATGNTPPVAMVGTAGFSIPLDTPFEMDGTGTDVDGDSLTYCWEEYDLGPAGDPNNPSGTAPIFRSFEPKTVSFRLFPKLGRILNDNQRIGEILPTYGRTLRFRLTVRDGLGGVHWDQGSLAVDDTAGPFDITSQNTPQTWEAGQQHTVTWDVANTTNAQVNCQTVNVLMSELGGLYDIVLASGTPNDGSELITVPSLNTVKARIRVEAADNIFFDINNADITITTPTGVELAEFNSGLRLEPARPNPFNGNTTIAYSIPAATHARIGVYDAAGRLVRDLANGTTDAGRHTASWDGTSRTGSIAASGIYFVRLETERGETRMQKVHLVR